jgi:hypothetical protein
VDESQEEALLKVQNGASLALHGPPGTGKSQVIVNLIANAMGHDKRVLLVSQKRAALDVVHKRLESLGLGRFAALVHDHRHDRKAIFAQLRRQLEDLDQFRVALRDLNFTQWEHHYRQISRQVDQLARSFDELHKALSTRRDHGLSPHELYAQSVMDEPVIPLGQEAKQLNQTRLVRLLDKLESLFDYRELFEPDYPWSARLSFHASGFDERKAIEQLLSNITEECLAISQERSELRADLPELSDAPGVNRELLDRFSHVRGLLGNAVLREDVEAILRENMRPSTVRKHLDGFEAEIESLGDLRLFQGFPWRRFDEIEKHLQVYNKSQKKAFRLLSLDYLKARWFLKKWLEAKGEKLSPTTFKALQSDFKSLKKVQRRFGKLYQHDFFHDFPLLESLEEKAAWLDRKRIHFDALGRLQEKGLGSLQPEFDHGHLLEKKWETQQGLAKRLEDYNRHLFELTGSWARFLSKKQIDNLFQLIHQPEALSAQIERLSTSLMQDFGDMQQADSLLANFDGTELSVWENVQKHTATLPAEPAERREAIRQSVLFYWLQQAEQEHPILATVSGRGFHRQQAQFARHVAERRKRVTELVSRRVKEQILDRIEYNRLGNPVTYRNIQHQVSKQRRLWSVRRLIKETWEEGLDKLLPCWMCSPETASAIFPLKPDFFDLVIFDEASQCFVERGLPALLRGKQWLVAGDHMQLQPFDLYTVRYEEEEAELTGYDAALEVENILDLARQRLEEVRLSWHYRSRDAALINFSNHAFYDGRLQVVPLAKKDPIHQPPISWRTVNGLWKNNRNEAEADEVIALVTQLLQREVPPSIGVVTFNYQQQELIKDKLDQRLADLATKNSEAYTALQAAMLPPPAEADKGLFVKNIENVQGDERDIIIFSIAYAPNEAGKLNTHFGLLSQRSGENRLNVAISRARLQAFVLCSFRPEALNVDDAAHPGPKLLRRFLQYTRAMSENKEAEADRLLEATGSRPSLSLPNPLAEEVAAELEQPGYRVVRELGDTAFKLDLAVQSAEGDFLLGIRCERPHYFGGRSAKAREVYRKALLSERGWKLYHVWSRNWRVMRAKELENILSELGDA